MAEFTANTWRDARKVVHDIANGLPIYYGTGSPIDRPHVTVSAKDGLNGPQGYDVWLYPEGNDWDKPYNYHSIVLE